MLLASFLTRNSGRYWLPPQCISALTAVVRLFGNSMLKLKEVQTQMCTSLLLKGLRIYCQGAALDICIYLQVTSTEVVLAARCKRKFANAHTYHVNSIALCSDQATFITADDLRINLWDLEISDQAFNVVDMKPPNMEELTEVSFLRHILIAF